MFDDIAITTYYPHVSFAQGREKEEQICLRLLVFLKTPDGWKKVHEHGTLRQ